MKKQITHAQRSTDVVRSILVSLIFAIGVLLSTAAPGDNPSLLAQNENSNASPVIGTGKGTDERESEDAREVPATTENTTNIEAFSPEAFPIVATNPATLVTSSSARLNGSVNPHGLPTTFFFQYGRTTNYGTGTPSHTRTGNTAQAVSANIGGLTPHTTYHFRLVARNATGTRYGSDRIFTTATPSPCNIAGRWSGTVHGTWYANNCYWTGTAFISAAITQNGTAISGSVDYVGVPCFNRYTCGVLDFADTTGYVTGSISNCPQVNATIHVTAITGACSGQTITGAVTLMLNGNTLSGTGNGYTVILTRQP
jgi:hypothetical protein